MAVRARVVLRPSLAGSTGGARWGGRTPPHAKAKKRRNHRPPGWVRASKRALVLSRPRAASGPPAFAPFPARHPEGDAAIPALIACLVGGRAGGALCHRAPCRSFLGGMPCARRVGRREATRTLHQRENEEKKSKKLTHTHPLLHTNETRSTRPTSWKPSWPRTRSGWSSSCARPPPAGRAR